MRGVLLVGPEGSGKSHLASIWCEFPGAARIAAKELARDDADRLTAGGVAAVEDLHDGPIDEPALFHLLNLAGERDAKIMITSRDGPGALPLTLPDFVSRLRAMRLVTLGAPDDELLRRVLTKLFADRQLDVDPGVIGYIATRMERSFVATIRSSPPSTAPRSAGGRGSRASLRRRSSARSGTMPRATSGTASPRRNRHLQLIRVEAVDILRPRQ